MPGTADEVQSEVSSVEAAYREVCASYHAIDDFRMKLLGLLPIVSVAGLFALDASGMVRPGTSTTATNEIAAYLSVFAALFTLALYVFEVRGILICHDLITIGRALEVKLRVNGQFCACAELRRTGHYKKRWQRILARHINVKLAASTIYSLVGASWLFVALNFGFRVPYPYCVIVASLSGLLLAAISYRVTWSLVESPAPDDREAIRRLTEEQWIAASPACGDHADSRL